MKSLLIRLFTLVALLANVAAFAQSTVTGVIVDGDDNSPIIGASVLVSGTSVGTVTDIDGKFTLNTDKLTGTLVISYIGYQTLRPTFAGTTDLGTIELGVSELGLSEVVVTGVMDIVEDRRTPVAVSTISTADIQAKGGNVEFPELMKSTPSIYVANQSGGYGDAEVFTRGFDQTNTAFLLNGQPINGMEDGKMYWSNWSGMTDVATAVQVQRGLGSSKLAISSVGGTTNIIMKPTALKQGGSASLLYGNDNYIKGTVNYNTGMINDKFGLSVLLTHWQGNGWADGTKGQGQNYFISAGYKADDRNTFSFLITGAPQWHDQNYTKKISDHYDNDEFNIKYNSNWGTYNGEYETFRRNFYHKPVANLNWDFAISDKSKLSTVLYASWGRGGGTGPIGNYSNYRYKDNQVDFDSIAILNQVDGNDALVKRASMNNHAWYGAVANFEQTLSDALTLNVGADLRTYHGDHFRQLVDLYGASSYFQFGSDTYSVRYGSRDITNTYKANPWSSLTNFAEGADQIAYSNSETISYAGVFGQLEYNMDKFSAYVQGAVSNQSHQRFEIFNEIEANEASEKVSNLGYNAKGGFSYSPNRSNTFFFNTGYYQRQPFHDNIYLNYSNTVNPVTQSENIFGLEAGWKFSTPSFAANVNVYRTSWKNRTNTSTIDVAEEVDGILFDLGGFINVTNLNQLHSGVELDFKYEVNSMFDVKGFASFGDWVYEGNSRRDLYDDQRVLVSSSDDLAFDGVHVGGAPQTSFGIGLDIKPADKLKFDVDYIYYDRLYSNIGASTDELELPSYGIMDFGASYRIDLGDNLLTLRANVFNVLGTEYISRASTAIPAGERDEDNWNGVNRSNRVSFGKTTTWNVSAKYSF